MEKDRLINLGLDLDSELDLKPLGVVDWAYTEEGSAASYPHFSNWVDQGKHSPLHYLSDERKEKREHLNKVFPPFQSALVFLFSYAAFKQSLEKRFRDPQRKNRFRMAAYALAFQGEDYHHHLKKGLLQVAKEIQNRQKRTPGMEVFTSLDVMPVLERDLAFRSGLGWFGKNSMLIHRHHGSYTLLGSVFFSEKLSPEVLSAFSHTSTSRERKVGTFFRTPEPDHCGHCTACVEACPTQAIDGENRTIDANQCISTFTIEIFKEGPPPPSGYTQSQGEIFGCDICQEVCPWNRKSAREAPSHESPQSPELSKGDFIFDFFLNRDQEEIAADLQGMSNKKFQKLFRGTPLERTGRRGLLKNLMPFLTR